MRMKHEGLDVAISLGFKCADARARLVGVTLVALARETSRRGALVGLEVDGKVGKAADREFPDFPTDLHRHIENQKAVDTYLVRAEGITIGKSRVAAHEMTIKGIAISGIVIERWGDLRVKVVRKSEPRAYLPR